MSSPSALRVCCGASTSAPSIAIGTAGAAASRRRRTTRAASPSRTALPIIRRFSVAVAASNGDDDRRSLSSSSSSPFPGGGGLDPSLELAVPKDQRPSNELASLRTAPLYSWVSKKGEEKDRAFFLSLFAPTSTLNTLLQPLSLLSLSFSLFLSLFLFPQGNAPDLRPRRPPRSPGPRLFFLALRPHLRRNIRPKDPNLGVRSGFTGGFLARRRRRRRPSFLGLELRFDQTHVRGRPLRGDRVVRRADLCEASRCLGSRQAARELRGEAGAQQGSRGARCCCGGLGCFERLPRRDIEFRFFGPLRFTECHPSSPQDSLRRDRHNLFQESRAGGLSGSPQL